MTEIPLSTDLRSFATEKNLRAALTKHGFDKLPHVIVRNAEGRWTAIFFGRSSNPVIFQGFKWILGFDNQ